MESGRIMESGRYIGKGRGIGKEVWYKKVGVV